MDSAYSQLSAKYGDKPPDYYDCSREELIPFVADTSRRVLDVGCSSGGFGELLKRVRPGIEVWGVEPETEVAKVAAGRLDKVINGLFSSNDPALRNEKFDTILFNDVLEHLVDPLPALKEAKALLTPSGQIIASIPNILFYYQVFQLVIRQDWKYQESGILDYTHLRFFTKKSILRMFDEAGLTVTRIEGINPDSSIWWRLFNLFTLGQRRDWKFTQFATCGVLDPTRQ